MMFQNKIYWIDDTDLWLAQKKYAAARAKYSECDWVRFKDDGYDNLESAYKDLVATLFTMPMFTPGKVVYCWGVPLKKAAGEYHQLLAKQFEKIATNVCFMIIAQPDLRSSIYKAAKAHGKADDPFELNKLNAVGWITEQAATLKLKIDKQSCQMLADLTDFHPAKIQNELTKLMHLASDGQISPRLVAMAGYGEGRSDVKELGTFILNNDGENAHEFLQRLLDRGEPPLKICGYLQDWITRLGAAHAAGCNFEAIRADVAELKKWDPSDKKDKHGNAVYETVNDDKWGHYCRRDGTAASMFGNPNSLWYACKELGGATKPPDWAYDGILKMFRLQNALRGEDVDEAKAMHEFVSGLIRIKKDEVSK